jgi:hypothetical protein
VKKSEILKDIESDKERYERWLDKSYPNTEEYIMWHSAIQDANKSIKLIKSITSLD